jgi:ubiquitin-protein ligase E3 A
LICGETELEFEDLYAVTTYDNGYTKDDQIIKYVIQVTESHRIKMPYELMRIRDFWEILYSLTLEQRKRFLFFCTGTDRAPIGGLKHIRFMIVKHGPDSDRLPQAHTCFNVLLLPNYATKDKLRDRLLTAIQNAEGFGML